MRLGVGGVAQRADARDDIFVRIPQLLQVLAAYHRAGGCPLHGERRLIGKAAVRQLGIHHNGLFFAGEQGAHVLLQRAAGQLRGLNALNDRPLRLLPPEVHVVRILRRLRLGLLLFLSEKRQLQMHLAVVVIHQMVLAVQERTAAQQEQHKDHDQYFLPGRRPAMIAVIPLGGHAAPPLSFFYG